MIFYLSGTEDIDTESLQLVFIRVDNYTVLKNVDINLNAGYRTLYQTETNTLEVNDRIIIKKEPGVDLKVFCGENGTGKTTLMRLIKNPERSFLLVVKDARGIFASTRMVSIRYNGKMFRCNIQRSMHLPIIMGEEDFRKFKYLPMDVGLMQFYIDHQSLLDRDGQSLFNGFFFEEMDLTSFAHHAADSITGTKYQGLFFSEDVLASANENLIYGVFAHEIHAGIFDQYLADFLPDAGKIYRGRRYNNADKRPFSITQAYNQIRNVNKYFGEAETILTAILACSFTLVPSLDNGQVIVKEAIADRRLRYSLLEYEEVFNKINNLFFRFDEAWQKACVYAGDRGSAFQISPLFHFVPFLKTEEMEHERLLSDLSSGEYHLVMLIYKLFYKLFEGCIILEDEPDRSLHPEWSRTLVTSYIDAIKKIRDYSRRSENGLPSIQDRLITILFTTHSPIMLSDFVKDEVVFLKKEKSGITVSEYAGECFAGNIGDMLCENFFLESTIGGFAKKRLETLVSAIDEFGPRPEIRDELMYYINRMGDKLLKSLLLEKLERSVRGDY